MIFDETQVYHKITNTLFEINVNETTDQNFTRFMFAYSEHLEKLPNNRFKVKTAFVISAGDKLPLRTFEVDELLLSTHDIREHISQFLTFLRVMQ